MQTDTQESLDTSKAFLRDAVEAAHLVLKRKLEALKAGEDVEWESLQEVIREGAKATRQLSQIASLEVRERNLKLREEKESGPAIQRVTGAVMLKLHDGLAEWGQALKQASEGTVPKLPEKLRSLMQQFGIDPMLDDCVERIQVVLEAGLERELAA